MGSIRVLPDHLANCIAAGEVVERPVSALKELLENSLDAGAKDIKISVRAGGKQRIRVEDDGCGMDRDDCLMAFERHATSKLTRSEDLFSIQTLGFRGEALPSIASVSQVTLESAKKGSEVGVRLVLSGNKIVKVTEIARRPGTTITVDRLFFNIPARKKFMRQTQTELAWIVNLVTQYSLAHIDKRFFLEHNGRKLIDVTPVSSLKERVYQHYGKSMLDHLLEVDQQVDWLHIRGLISTPNFFKTTRNFQFSFINGRLVKDRILSHAITQAYQGFGDGRVYPVVLLFVSLPSAEVDVNVHPAKTEVKFIHPGFVHDRVVETVRKKLVARPLTTPYRFHDGAHSFPSEKPQTRTLPRQFEKGPDGQANRPFVGRGQKVEFSRSASGQVAPDGKTLPGSSAEQNTEMQPAESDLIQPDLQISDPIEAPRVIGQFRQSYILADDGESLLLIDQHVAHERIRYDQIKSALTARQVERQVLLVPVTVELTPDQRIELESVTADLDALGFEAEPFDEFSMVIRAVPAILARENVIDLVLTLFEKLRGKQTESTYEAVLDSIAAGQACRGSVKVNMSLSMEKMQHLVDTLWHSSSPLFCPHGRPIVLTFSNDEIERNFFRK